MGKKIEFSSNPIIPVCFICRRPKKKVALIKSLDGGMPEEKSIDWEPCNLCEKEHLVHGTLILEAWADREGNPVPTGKYQIVLDKALQQLGIGIPINKKLVASTETFKQLSDIMEEAQQKLDEITAAKKKRIEIKEK